MKSGLNFLLLILILNVLQVTGQWVFMDTLANALSDFESSGALLMSSLQGLLQMKFHL